MKSVTIDNLDMKVHERYAEDQQKLDSKYIKEATLIASHPEIAGTSSIYSSKWEELFEIQKKNISWAMFAPPPKYTLQSNRFFTYQILPSIYVQEEEEEQEEKEGEQEEGKNQEKSQCIEEIEQLELSLLQKLIQATNFSLQTTERFEKEKTELIDLLNAIKYLNGLLAQIHSRKLQYQKG